MVSHNETIALSFQKYSYCYSKAVLLFIHVFSAFVYYHTLMCVGNLLALYIVYWTHMGNRGPLNPTARTGNHAIRLVEMTD